MFFTRYDEEAAAVSEQTTQNRLQALKDKILARKAQKHEEKEAGETLKKQSSGTTQEHAHPKKRRKLSGPENGYSVPESVDILSEEQNPAKRKKKKKSKKDVSNSDQVLDSGNQISEVNESIAKVKKKKSKCERADTEVHVDTESNPVTVCESTEKVIKTKKKKSKKSKFKITEFESDPDQTLETTENDENKTNGVIEEQNVEENLEEKSAEEEWTIIGKQKSDKHVAVENVKRDLPDWIVDHEMIDPDFNNKVLLEEFGILDKKIVDVLENMEIKSLFPIQHQIIPDIVDGCCGVTMLSHKTFTPPRDLCVSAPTGSGKTLVYALSLVQCLKTLPPMLQAVVIVPTKNLAVQVKRVFNNFQSLIKVVLLSGKETFPTEQKQLYTDEGLCQAHVAVATPGRLVNHLRDTKLFTLQHLRFLVIDEMDTLLTQTYQDWLPSLFKTVYNPSPYQHPLQPHYHTPRYTPGSTLSLAELHAGRLPLQKLLFSATVTHDPGKLAPLQLYRPKLYSCGEKYTLPSTLQQYQIRCQVEDKPLIILYLVKEVKHVLCFTSSVETAHRLAILTEEFGGIKVAEYSSTLSKQQRNKVVRDFALGHIDLLVCSDSLARGMDIAQVDHVVNYDVPVHVQTYVHRVGRTARAGRAGSAYTLIKHEETHHFHQMLKKAGDTRASDWNVPDEFIAALSHKYQSCLTQLEKRLKNKKTK